MKEKKIKVSLWLKLRRLNPWHYKKLYKEWFRTATLFKAEKEALERSNRILNEMLNETNNLLRQEREDCEKVREQLSDTQSALVMSKNELDECVDALHRIQNVIDALNPKIRLGALREIKGLCESALSDHPKE